MKLNSNITPSSDEKSRGESIAERLIDWLSFTVLQHAHTNVISRLGLDFVELPHGHHGYRAGAVSSCGTVRVFWNGSVEGMGTHVQVSGQGCRLLESLEGFGDWRTWLSCWRDLGAKFTRVDFALDDLSGRVKMATVLDSVRGGHLVRKGTTWSTIEKNDSKGMHQTLYVGSRTSDVMLRCYDKGLQLGQASRLRFEIEYKRERADAWVTLLIEQGWDAAAGAVRASFEFKDPTHEIVDRSRRRVADWWRDLVDASKHVINLARTAQRTLEQTYAWLRRQCAPAIAALAQVEGGAVDFFLDLEREGRCRLSQRHRQMIQHASLTPTQLCPI